MESVVVGIAFAALFALWFIKKPEWSRHHEGLDPLPRAALSPAPAVPPRALQAADAGALFRPDIEGLRSIAVLLVLVYHAKFDVFSGGFIGVDVFFVLSGFLITSLLLRELAATGTISLANFWARRARRLLPASGLVLLVTLVSSRWLIDGLSQGNLARDAIAGCLFVANIRFWSVGTDYLSEGLRESPLLHFWSLAVEEQFYLVWPATLLVLVKVMKVSRRTLAVIIGVGFAVSLAACVWLTHFGEFGQPQWAFFMLPARAWELFAGAALALAGGHLFRLGRQTVAILGWVGVGAVLAVAIEFDVTTPFPGAWAIVPVLATVLVINAGHVPEGPIRILAARPLQWIGARSYAIYLWHFPMLVMVGRKWGDEGLIENLPVATRLGLLVASVGFAAISYHLVENPVRHSAALSLSPARSLAMGAWVALLGVGGAALLLNNPPELSAGGVAAEVTLATGTTEAPTTTAAEIQPVPGSSTTALSTTTSTTEPRRAADASMDNPTALAPLLAANLPVLTEAVAIGSVPSNLNPSLNRAGKDLPQVYDNGCILEVGDNEPKQCIYGDPNGAVTIVLFGDSHAAEWMPALHKVSSVNGWRLIVHTKKACPDAEIPTDKDPNGTDCAVWRERVIELIGGLQPDLVIMSSYRYKQVGSASGRDPDQVWREGIELTVSKVRPLTDHLLLLGDSATPKEDIPTCLAGSLSNVPHCMSSRSEAVKPGRLAVERDVALAYDADFIPTSDWMCTATACPVIVGNVLMYRDNSHITATASEFLSPYVEAAVKAVLA